VNREKFQVETGEDPHLLTAADVGHGAVVSLDKANAVIDRMTLFVKRET
jgi:hypothetical protein